ncbi:cation-translocating P-type ATPase [Jeongeupia chitinilytica]|uniref:ATPase n=1 Tax=Jeongeupia chitinilytica TaxID=1041641 RepID=A0ABQ3GZE8_9NEIS|nr:cation-translocating P-type ATPase [Jeongeupia chitinilytica]GHD62829.1 ATPase [Jeongeupia chitinilytica]
MDIGERRWHSLDCAQAMHALAVSPAEGLSSAVAAERSKQYGENQLAEAVIRPPWLKFVDQFRGFLIMVLMSAVLLALAIGHLEDALAILIVIVLNATIGFIHERRAERTLSALKGMLTPHTRVRREGVVRDIETRLLVPGDIVQLEAGGRVPADGRILAAHYLEVDEATLTGESQPVCKSNVALADADLPPGDRINMLFMNTVITRGRAELLVTAIGMQTEVGQLAGLIATADAGTTPLQQQLDLLGKKLAAIAGTVVVLIFVLDFNNGVPWIQAAVTAVALAVAAIPEGLPAVVTVTLAIGMWRMAKHRAIVRKLSAVETLGSTTVICSDKTGTLTANQMTARAGYFAGRHFSVNGEGYLPTGKIAWPDNAPALAPLLLPAVLCSEPCVREGQLIGDPTEGALWVLAQKGGVDPDAARTSWPRIAEIPFDSANKFMATFHHAGDMVEMAIKGAPDVLLARSTRWLGPDGEQRLDAGSRERIERENEALARKALRVIALAKLQIPANAFDPACELANWTCNWTFLGLAGLTDPPRPQAKAAIMQCSDAGITVKMITGDHKATAMAIARELGLAGAAVSGNELEAMDDATLAGAVEGISVFARVSPAHKVRIVRALQAAGHVVAMTGDGINDAPALKAADIGIAMGRTGTAVTREAAKLVLTDDNFATIVQAVQEGRVVYDNIVKFVRFQLSTNIGAILTVLGATLLGWPAPFTAIQLLWINVIMDGPPAMTLGIEPARPGLMHDRPRPRSEQILRGPRLLRLVIYGLTMTAGTLLIFRHGLATHGQPYALTLAFTTFVLFQLFNAFNARAEYDSALGTMFFSNGRLWLTLASVLAMQGLAVHWASAQMVFDTVDLTVSDWIMALAIASSVLLLDEARKVIWRCCRSQGN